MSLSKEEKAQQELMAIQKLQELGASPKIDALSYLKLLQAAGKVIDDKEENNE